MSWANYSYCSSALGPFFFALCRRPVVLHTSSSACKPWFLRTLLSALKPLVSGDQPACFLGSFPQLSKNSQESISYFSHLHHKLVPPFLLPLIVAPRWAYLHRKRVGFAFFHEEKGVIDLSRLYIGWIRIRAQ